MFLEFYGLRDQPFGVTPDPRYLYFSRTHREALGSLFYGIETGCGFMTLIAPPGVGKTTVLSHLMDKLRNSAQTAFLFHTQCDSREFVSQLLIDLGVDCGDENLAYMYEALHSVLLRNARTGRRFVLVIDEAQNLADSVLETVRLLSDFETTQSKLMQIVLCGQPQLAERLADPDLIQLRQRISIVSKLHPLSSAETMMYLDHRLSVAGYTGHALFGDDAIGLIIAHSGGVPRNINNICFNALTLGYAKRQKQIDAPVVHEVLSDLDLDALSASKMFATGAPDSTVSSKRLPQADQSHRQLQADVTAAWAADSRKRMPEGHQNSVPRPVLGLNSTLPTRTESQQAKKPTLATNFSASLDSVFATHPGATTGLAQSATTSTSSQNEPSVPATSYGPTPDFLRSPLGRAELPPGFIAEAAIPATNAVDAVAPAVESQANVLPQMPVRPIAAVPLEASTGVSLQVPEGRTPVPPSAPPADPVNQPSLTDVLSKYFGTPLSTRVIGKLPPVPDRPPTLEA
jgi:general secretion pathway protein A